MKWIYNWKFLFFGTFIIFLIIDIMDEAIMIIGLLFGWMIGIATKIQWDTKKDAKQETQE